VNVKKLLKVFLVSSCVSVLSVSANETSTGAETSDQEVIDNLSLSDLFNIDVPTVISASKSEKKLDKAPSIITVWTDKDIKRMGVRSVKELLDKTVGFFNNRQYSNATLNSRGLGADGNEAYLLLIDGHNCNSIVIKGCWSEYMFPFVSEIKQVEIMRGPGSTLWGADAALGTIHIITKSGSDINGLKITGNGSMNQNGDELAGFGNILAGGQLGENSDAMVSVTYANSNGYPDGGSLPFAGSYEKYRYREDDWWGSNNSSNQKLQPFDKIHKSYQVYSKARMGNLILTGRAADMMMSNMWGDKSSYKDSTNYMRKRTVGIEARYTLDFSTAYHLETKVYGDIIDFAQLDMEPQLSAYKKVELGTLSSEQAWGGEIMFTGQFTKWLDAKIGLRATETRISPIYDIRFRNLSTDPGATTAATWQVIPTEFDQAIGGYAEANVDFDFIVVGGGARLDWNNLREKGIAILPRASVIWSPMENFTAKYLFNSGYVRPPAMIGFLDQTPIKEGSKRTLYGADKSEKIFTNDLGLSYNTDKFNFSVTGYRTDLQNYFNYSGAAWDIVKTTGKPYRQGGDWVDQIADSLRPGGTMFIINAGDIVSYGLEIEGKYKLLPNLVLNGNFSEVFSAKFKKSTFENKHVPSDTALRGILDLAGSPLMDKDLNMNGFPKHSWNIGVDYGILEWMNINLQYRGFAGLQTKSAGKNDQIDANPANVFTEDKYVTLPSGHYIDLNLHMEPNIKAFPFSVDIYAKNLIDAFTGDNKPKIGYLPHGGYWESQGFVVGANLTLDVFPLMAKGIKKE
jgi:iron complex outermembrane receptor protein